MDNGGGENEIRKRYLAVDTSNVADVLDELHLPNQGLASSFRPMTGQAKLAGSAFTIQGHMQPYDLEGDPEKMTACAAVKPGQVTVWSGEGTGICYFGELIAMGMKELGAAGALLDGGIRDIKWIRELGFPVFARYRTPIQSIGRWKVTAWQQPVALKGSTSSTVMVYPGDFILGDEDGVVVVPKAKALEVLEKAEALTNKETLIRREIKGGLSLTAALTKFGRV